MSMSKGTDSSLKYTVTLPPPSNTAVQEALSGFFQGTEAHMRQLLLEVNKLKDTVSALTLENQTLRTEKQTLTAEKQKLEKLLQDRDSGGASRPEPRPEAPAASREDRGQERASFPGDGSFAFERSIKLHTAPVHSVTFAQSGDVIATASWDSYSKLYSIGTDQVVRTLGEDANGPATEGRMGGLYSVAFAKTAPEILGCTSCDKSVYLWNRDTGKLKHKLTEHTDEVNGIDFHHSQPVMCTASDDNKVLIWDFLEGIPLRTLDKHTAAVYGATFLGQEMQYNVATCSFDQKNRVFDMRDRHVVAVMHAHSDDIIGIDFSGTRKLLATGSDDGKICLWDIRTWRLQQTIDTKAVAGIQDNEVKRVSFSPDGSQLAAACSSGCALVYDVAQGVPTLDAKLGGHDDCVFDVAWGTSAGKTFLVSASHDHTCRLWRKV